MACDSRRARLLLRLETYTLSGMSAIILAITMAKPRRAKTLPIPVRRALRKLGADIRDARRRRRIPVAIMAERASISRMTLNKIEKGEPGVSMGAYATVLFALGLVDRLTDLADARTDAVGLELEEEHLPQRIRRPRGARAARSNQEGSG